MFFKMENWKEYFEKVEDQSKRSNIQPKQKKKKKTEMEWSKLAHRNVPKLIFRLRDWFPHGQVHPVPVINAHLKL